MRRISLILTSGEVSTPSLSHCLFFVRDEGDLAVGLCFHYSPYLYLVHVPHPGTLFCLIPHFVLALGYSMVVMLRGCVWRLGRFIGIVP